MYNNAAGKLNIHNYAKKTSYEKKEADIALAYNQYK